MRFDPKTRIAVSTWSVNRLLQTIPLEALPEELAKRGYARVEICHFHLATQEPDYLRHIGTLFRDHGVSVQTLLIDDGDITNPSTRDDDLKWIASWIESAAQLGAVNARVIAGKGAPDDAALKLSVDGLIICAALGEKHKVRVVTENWFDTLSTPEAVHHVLDAVGPSLGFLADTGNWHGPTKYSDLQTIFARAELCHAKTSFAAGLELDKIDNAKWLAAAQASDYAGPYTLIFADDGDEWEGLNVERDFIMRNAAA
jgi:sugar phosphate isomerase/epimerase